MARIEKFEDLEVWKLAKDAANQIYDITSVGKFSQDYILRDQVRRAVVSIFQILLRVLRETVIKNSCNSCQLPKPLAERFAHS